MINVQDQVARTTKTLIFTEPFYGLFLIGINKTYSEQIPTAGHLLQVAIKAIGQRVIVPPYE